MKASGEMKNEVENVGRFLDVGNIYGLLHLSNIGCLLIENHQATSVCRSGAFNLWSNNCGLGFL
jgi:hypothetical protein